MKAATGEFCRVAASVLLLVNLVASQVQPIPGDCTRYQVCDYSGCFIFRCGIGTEFNPRILVCDYPLRDRGYCGSRDNLGLGLIANPGYNAGGYPGGYPGNAGYPANSGYPASAGSPAGQYPGNAAAGYPGSNVIY